jgi:hypothetical protein
VIVHISLEPCHRGEKCIIRGVEIGELSTFGRSALSGAPGDLLCAPLDELERFNGDLGCPTDAERMEIGD